jgi:plastocyanin
VHNAAPTSRRRLATVATLGAAALALFTIAGCGGDDDDETVATTPPTTTGATGATGAQGQAQEVDISETDFELDPSDPTVKAGTVTFNVTNDGDTTHNLEVEGDGVEEELEQDLAVGESGELTVDLEPGTYEMYCPIANHRDLGMEGEVTVEE